METVAAKTTEQVSHKLKDIRKEIADKLDLALTEHKIILGAEKLSKHIKKISKSLAEDIVKATNKKAKKKGVKGKKKSPKKK